MVQRVKKSTAVSVVSKTQFVRNPQFDLDPKVEQIKYNSATTKRPRWMVALTEDSAKKLTADQKSKYCTVENGHCYVHVDHENLSGKVQFGILPWSDKGLQGFFNVKADEETQKKHDNAIAKQECKEALQKLQELVDDELITEEDFAAQKAEILRTYTSSK